MNENNNNQNQIDEPIEPLDIKGALRELDSKKDDTINNDCQTIEITSVDDSDIKEYVEPSKEEIVYDVVEAESVELEPKKTENKVQKKKNNFHDDYYDSYKTSMFSGEKILSGTTKAVGFTIKSVFKIIGKCFKVLLEALMTLMLVGFISGAVVGCVFFMYIDNYFDPEYDIDGLEFDINQTTTMWYVDSDGRQIQLEDETLYGSENRTWAQYSSLPGDLVKAFVAVEDKRFFEHNGVDFRRTFSAFVNFFIPMKASYGGGSTITQQLIKNNSTEDDVKIQRKIQEMLRAWNLETKKSKEEILELYLNTIYLSQNSYGVQAAAQTYFGKDVSELTLVECAALAALPKSPTKYDPIRNPQNNLERRRTVLKLMFDQGKITFEQYSEAYEVVDLDIKTKEDDDVTSNVHSYYIDAVIDQVIEDLSAQYGYSKAIASQYLYSGGLKIVTCMDPYVQNAMEEVYVNYRFEGEEDRVLAQSSMVIMNPDTGDVLGLVGGRGEKIRSRGLNRATKSKRQCGSSIKPISCYGLALEEGLITYGTVIDDTPTIATAADPTVKDSKRKVWPTNVQNSFSGLTTINVAIDRSFNTVSAKVVEMLTPQKCFNFLTEKLHLSTLVEEYVNDSGDYFSDIAVGPMAHGSLTFGVTTLEMCAAYTIFANEGVYSAPRIYSQVTDTKGDIILQQNEQHEIVVKESTAYIMTKMLEEVVTTSEYGDRLRLIREVYPNLKAAAKTGTTQNNRDRYFVGYTPYYVGATWFGYDNNKVLSRYEGSPAMTLWDEVMILVHERINEEENGNFVDFRKPGDVIEAKYCLDSGMVYDETTCGLDPRGHRYATGYFELGTEPSEKCDKHVVVNWDSVTKCVAANMCPAENITQIALVRNDSRDFGVQIYIADAQYVYRDVPEGYVYPMINTNDAYPNSIPFFYNLPNLQTEKILGGDGKTMIDFYHYVGITSLSTGKHAVNCFCYTHYDPNYNANVSETPSEDISENDSSVTDESSIIDESIVLEESIVEIAPAA